MIAAAVRQPNNLLHTASFRYAHGGANFRASRFAQVHRYKGRNERKLHCITNFTATDAAYEKAVEAFADLGQAESHRQDLHILA